MLFKKPKPNVIFIIIDQCRADKRHVHPVFEKLGKQSVQFSNMVTYAPYTLAALHAVFTGMYGNKNGVDAYYKAMNFDKENCYTLAQYLKDSGYSTTSDTFSDILIPKNGIDKFQVYDEKTVDIEKRHKELLEKNSKKKKPFFLCLHYHHIHKTIVDEVIKKYSDFDKKYFDNIDKNTKKYENLVRKAGDYLSIILNQINKLKLDSNSLVVVITDHGGGLGEKPGEKSYGIYTYDYSIKTWAYFQHKNLPKNKHVKNFSRTIDITPTILDILKIKQKKGYKEMDGTSLIPVMLGKKKIEYAFIETAGLDGPTPSPYEPNVKCIRTNKWKLIFNTTTKKKELYNLENDSKEIDNLADTGLEIEQKLWNILVNYI